MLGERSIELPAPFAVASLLNSERNEALTSFCDGLRRRGWTSLLNLPYVAYPDLVREFYTNITSEEYTSYVRGVDINFSPATINNLLGIASVGNQCQVSAYTGGKISREIYSDILCEGHAEWLESKRPEVGARALIASSMTMTARLWWAFVRGILLPITHHFSVTPQRLWCLRVLVEDQAADVGRIIASEILELHDLSSKKAALSYPQIISQLCLSQGVSAEGLATLPPKPPMNLKSVFGENYLKGGQPGLEGAQAAAATADPSSIPPLASAVPPTGDAPASSRSRDDIPLTPKELRALSANLRKSFLQNEAILRMQPLLVAVAQRHEIVVPGYDLEPLREEHIASLCRFEEPASSTSSHGHSAHDEERAESSPVEDLDAVVEMATTLGSQSPVHTTPHHSPPHIPLHTSPIITSTDASRRSGSSSPPSVRRPRSPTPPPDPLSAMVCYREPQFPFAPSVTPLSTVHPVDLTGDDEDVHPPPPPPPSSLFTPVSLTPLPGGPRGVVYRFGIPVAPVSQVPYRPPLPPPSLLPGTSSRSSGDPAASQDPPPS